MEQAYWLERARASIANAYAALGSESRLRHFDLAGRYSIKAANACGASPDGREQIVQAVLVKHRHRGMKAPRDTAAGCRNRAEADLRASASLALANQRLRLEVSAAHWIARADLLQAVEDAFVAPKAVGSPNQVERVF